MANTIIAGNGTNNGLAVTSDATGALNILTGSGGGTAAISIDSSQNVTVAGNVTASGTLAVTSDQTVGGNLTVTGTVTATGGVSSANSLRAWVNFNGTGTVAISGSGNVSSITDNGVGLYTINFTTAMPDTNFSAAAIPAGDARYVAYVSRTTSTLGISVANASLTRYDVDPIMVQVFR
jgi:hypothetical protein